MSVAGHPIRHIPHPCFRHLHRHYPVTIKYRDIHMTFVLGHGPQDTFLVRA